jgi:hypothetical protein
MVKSVSSKTKIIKYLQIIARDASEVLNICGKEYGYKQGESRQKKR